MSRIIIDFPDDVYPEIAILAAQKVIEGGKISEASGRKKYCHATRFTSAQGPLWIYTRDRRRDSAPDSFLIIKDKE